MSPLAGIDPIPQPPERPGQLAGTGPIIQERAGEKVQLAGATISAPVASRGPAKPNLGPLANPESLATRGLRVYATRKRSVIDRHPPMVGARAMLSIDFYDVVSKQAVSPDNVYAEIEHAGGGGTETIGMTENTGRIGYYTCSFIPSMSGDWNARAKYGDGNEAIDSTRFYVLPAQ